MKITKAVTTGLIVILITIINFNSFSQGKEQRDVKNFTGIEARGAFELTINNGEDYDLTIEANDNLLNNITINVIDSVLYIETTNIKHPEDVRVSVTLPELTMLNAGKTVSAKGTSVFKADRIVIRGSGASDIDINVEADELGTTVSGASDVKLSGSTAYNNIRISGAGSLDAKNLITKSADCYISGAGSADLNVTDKLEGSISGAGSYTNVGEPRMTSITRTDNNGNYTSHYYANDYSDSVKVKVGRLEVNYYEDNDSVKIRLGNRELKVDDNGNVSFQRCKPMRFNGHWAGFEMGINGYVNPDFNMNFPKTNEYLDLNMAKSIAVYVNFFEQNVALSKNQKWGMVTGFGTYWNNYRFSKDTRLNADSSALIGYIDQGISIRKSKLTTWYLTVPLLFEFQTNNRMKKNSFHIAVGMIAGIRLTSHTKKYYDEWNKDFNVTLYNPETDKYETVFTATSPDYSKVKDFDDYFLQPFKFDATVRIGWGFVNLFATYSVNQMFRKDKGPEVYPWSAGITFVNF